MIGKAIVLFQNGWHTLNHGKDSEETNICHKKGAFKAA